MKNERKTLLACGSSRRLRLSPFTRSPSAQAQLLVHPCMPEIPNSRRDIPNCSEIERQGAPGNLTAARQSSRREVLLLSLITLFVAVGVGLFTTNAAKLTVQVN